jgi:hypothetical protein
MTCRWLTPDMEESMTIEKATGGLLNPGFGAVQQLTRANVRENGYAMPYHSPSYAPPQRGFWIGLRCR